MCKDQTGCWALIQRSPGRQPAKKWGPQSSKFKELDSGNNLTALGKDCSPEPPAGNIAPCAGYSSRGEAFFSKVSCQQRVVGPCLRSPNSQASLVGG